MKNYSPAPWIETEDEDGNVIVVMDKAHSVVVANLEGSCQTCHANARLIAAAPKLLNQLERLLYVIEHLDPRAVSGRVVEEYEKTKSVISEAVLPETPIHSPKDYSTLP